jgi:hypothetical protein
MVVETWIKILRKRLEHISFLLRLGASVDAFLGVETSCVHLLVGQVTTSISQCTYQAVRPD